MRKLLSVLSSTLQGGVRGGLLFLALMATTCLLAYDFQSGDLYYEITSSSAPYTVEVTSKTSSYPYNAGVTFATATIPETVTHNGTTYSVTSIGEGAFCFCSSLTSVTIPNSVISIGDSAFYNCSSLTSVTIGNSVTSIGDEAFYRCTSLTSITIPNSVTSIGEFAFYNCSSLPSINIPNSITNIEDYAFSGCSSLTSITIPNSVTSIGKGAFGRCFSLTSITIPNSVTSIGEIAFNACSKLTSVTIPNSVTSIGDEAFRYCRSLTSVTIPNSVTSIAGGAFQDCSSLTSVTIPNSATSIGDYAFSGCSKLTSVTCEAENPPTLYSSVFYGVSTSIPVYVPCGCVKAYKAESGWKDFTNIQEPLAEYSIQVNVNDIIMGSAKVNYNTFCEGNQISATPNIGYHFVKWSDGNTDAIRTLELTQDTILTAEFAQSFSGQCGDNLYWELGDTTLHITGKGAMYDYKYNTAPWKLLVSSIKSLSVSEGTTSIGDRAFSGCSSLTSVTIPESVTSIGNSAFAYCSKLTSVTIPESVTSIGYYAFYGCSSLTSIIIPESVTSIEYAAFAYCSVIDSIVWNAKNCADASSLENAPFYAIRSQITSFTFGENVEHIPAYLCDGMDKLTSVTIPESVTSSGSDAFSGCSVLDSIVWNAKNCADASSLETAPFYAIRSQITSFTFGENVEHIPAYLCDGMEKLTSVTIPNSVKTIGTSAFEGCARLGKISLGTGLEEIAANAFAGCTRLYDIYTYATYPPFAEESSFANYNVYVYVPCEYQRDYTLDIVWGKFKFIECIDSEDVTTDGNVTVVPGFNDVTITWPTAENADSYSLVINKDNQPFCTLTFNQEGQLLNIAFAPSRDGNNRPAQYAAQTVSGYRFTVTGLTEATQYAYNITTKDAANNTIATYSGEFRTQSTDDRTVTVEYDAAQGQVTGAGTYLVGETVTLTAIPNDGYRFVRWSNEIEDNPYTFVISDNVTLSAEFEAVIHSDVENATPSQQSDTHKLLRDGQLLILRDGKTYNVMGAEIQ